MKRNSGFTLIEIIVVMGLLALIAGLAAAVNFGAYKSYAFQSERNLLVMVIQKARSQSLNNVCLGNFCNSGLSHGVAIRPIGQSSGYVIFQGPNYSGRDQSQDEIFASNTQIALSGLSEIVFSQLSADANASGTINLADGIRTGSLDINYEGRISW